MPNPYDTKETLRWIRNFIWPSKSVFQAAPWASSEQVPSIIPKACAKVVLVGDIAKSHGYTASAELRAIFDSADLVVGNCETTVFKLSRAHERSFLKFNLAPDVFFSIIDEFGIPRDRFAVSLANNHALDYGAEGLANTASELEDRGVRTFGWTDGRRAQGWRSFGIGGNRIELYAWTQWCNAPNDRAHRVVEHVNLHPASSTAVRIGFPHWGFEFQHFPRLETMLWAQDCGHSGFDLIAGHHPHVAQPIEWVGRCLCCYSLGNFGSPAIGWSTHVYPVLEAWVHSPGIFPTSVVGYRLSFWTERTSAGDGVIRRLDEGDPNLQKRWLRLAQSLYGTAAEQERQRTVGDTRQRSLIDVRAHEHKTPF